MSGVISSIIRKYIHPCRDTILSSLENMSIAPSNLNTNSNMLIVSKPKGIVLIS
jgi:hypothetical protein